MLDMIKRLDFWLMIGAVAFAIWLEIDKLRAWWSRRSVKRSWYIDPGIVSRGAGPEQVADSPQTNPQALVRSQQDQVRTDRTVSFEDVRMWIAEHNMTDEQAVILFATAHRQPDDFFLSANKIRDGIGGARDEVLAQVAQCRPRPKAPKPSNRLDRPKEGWRSAG